MENGMEHKQPDVPEVGQDHGGDIALPTILMVGLAGTAILMVIIILVRGLFVNMVQQERYHKVIAVQPVELLQVREQAQTRLNSYEWTDRANGFVSIPINQAMALAAARLSAEQAKPQPTSTPVVEDTPVEAGPAVEVIPPREEPAQVAGAESGRESPHE